MKCVRLYLCPQRKNSDLLWNYEILLLFINNIYNPWYLYILNFFVFCIENIVRSIVYTYNIVFFIFISGNLT